MAFNARPNEEREIRYDTVTTIMRIKIAKTTKVIGISKVNPKIYGFGIPAIPKDPLVNVSQFFATVLNIIRKPSVASIK